MKRIYVGNLPFSTTEDELNTVFAEYGDVHNVDIIMDRQTDETRVAIEASVVEAISDYASTGKLAIPMPSFVVSAVKPT